MKNIHQPIRRDAALAPLSKEHHEGLLFSWKIKEGLRLGVETERIARYCKWFWHNHLLEHFEEEEAVFPKLLAPDHPMLLKMLDDHETIKSRIENMDSSVTAEELQRLAQIISYHIRFEERQLFNYVQDLATEEQKKLISELVQAHEQPVVASSWKDEFWLRNNSIIEKP